LTMTDRGDVNSDMEEQIRAAHTNTLVERMGIEITEATSQRVVGRMPVEGNTQPYGLLHGGASCVLAETLGSTGAAIHAGPGRIAMGIEINATHHRSATSGYVTGVATQVHGGRTIATYSIEITDEQGRLVCTSRLTCMLRDI
jgi:1,4-dihydroxy-2-naphthoyl-CoA hydrolase